MTISHLGGKALIASGSILLPDQIRDFTAQTSIGDITFRATKGLTFNVVGGGLQLVLEVPDAAPNSNSYKRQVVPLGSIDYDVATLVRHFAQNGQTWRLVEYVITVADQQDA